MFESESPLGSISDITLIIAISLSIIISFVETVPSLAHTFKLVFEILDYHYSCHGVLSCYLNNDALQTLLF